METKKYDRDEVKTAVATAIKNIADGEAPAEMVALYKSLGPEAFGYWLHGFYCGYCERTELQTSQAIRYLVRSLTNNLN